MMTDLKMTSVTVCTYLCVISSVDDSFNCKRLCSKAWRMSVVWTGLYKSLTGVWVKGRECSVSVCVCMERRLAQSTSDEAASDARVFKQGSSVSTAALFSRVLESHTQADSTYRTPQNERRQPVFALWPAHPDFSTTKCPVRITLRPP